MKQDWEIYRDTGILGAYRPEQVILGRCGILRVTVPACPNEKEVTMAGQENQQYTVLYGRLSQEDARAGESNSIQHQELICKGWFLPPNTYDCGSFVVNGTAVVGKEKKSPYNRWKSTRKGANFYEISI